MQRRGLPDLLAAVAGEAGERIGCRKVLHVGLGETGSVGEVLRVDEEALGAGGFNALGRFLAEAADQAQAEPNGGVVLAIARFERAVVVAVVDVDGPYFDLVPPRVLHQLAGAVETQRLRVQQRAQEGGRLVMLEPAADVGEQCEAGCMQTFMPALRTVSRVSSRS